MHHEEEELPSATMVMSSKVSAPKSQSTSYLVLVPQSVVRSVHILVSKRTMVKKEEPKEEEAHNSMAKMAWLKLLSARAKSFTSVVPVLPWTMVVCQLVSSMRVLLKVSVSPS